MTRKKNIKKKVNKKKVNRKLNPIDKRILSKNEDIFCYTGITLQSIFKLLNAEEVITYETYEIFKSKLNGLSSSFTHLQGDSTNYDLKSRVFYEESNNVKILTELLNINADTQTIIINKLQEQTDAFSDYFGVLIKKENKND